MSDPISRAVLRLQQTQPADKPQVEHRDSDLAALQDLAPLARAVSYAAEMLPRLKELEAENARLRDESASKFFEVAKSLRSPYQIEREPEEYAPVSIKIDRNGEGLISLITATSDDGDICAYRVQRDATGKVAMLLDAEEPVAWVVRDPLGRIASIQTQRPDK
jgi:hypothetical protein